MKPPKHQRLSFVRSESTPKTYHLTGSRFKTFVSVKIEEPYTPRLREMGAKYVLQGYDRNGNKTIFTGLFAMGNGWYFGDHYTPSRAKRNRLILVKPTKEGFILYYFSTYLKRISKTSLLTLLKWLIRLHYISPEKRRQRCRKSSQSLFICTG